jgi:hypothetical protein
VTTPPRPDQIVDPPAAVLAPGGASGVFRGRLVIISGSSTTGGSGLFAYSPVPGKNNLIYSVTAASGTDSYGNTVFGGATSYSVQAGTYYALNMSGSGFPPRLSWYVSGSDQTGTYTLMYGLFDTVSGSVHGLSLNNVPFADPPGAWAAPLLASDPAGANAGVTETWHDFGTLSNSWSVGVQAKYKLTAEGELMVSIVDLVPGTTADGTIIWSAANGLPAPYQPATTKQMVCSTNALRVSPVSAATQEAASLKFFTDGSVQCVGVAAAATRVDLAALIPITI